MLVLTRKVDQGIVISGNIYVRVLGVERDRVKLGIAAPLEVVVLREELLDRPEKGKAGKKLAPPGRNEDTAASSSPSTVTTQEEAEATEDDS